MNLYKKIAVALLPIVAILTTAYANDIRLEKNIDETACQKWVDSVYNSLTERQRVGQLIFPKVVTTQGANTKSALKRLVEQGGVGGILFTEGSIAQYVEMTNYAQSLAKVPLMMTFDGEWGLAMRIKNSIRFPNNMAIGAASNAEEIAYLYGKEMGRQSNAIGIHVNFAPVADVNSNAANPVIGYRSFGEEPQAVARLVNAYSRGIEEEGVQAVAKHFPGHGDTSTDSHKTLPTVGKTMAQLGETELVPFVSFINDGGSGIMTAHLAVKAIDPTGTPMSLSAPAHELLREKLGFDGLVYTDALGMRGAVTPDGGNPSIAALKAGADVLLSPRNPMEDIDAILLAVKDGKIKKSVIEDRCKRILRYKYLLGLASGVAPLNEKEVEAALHSPEAVAVNRMVSSAVFTALVNKNNVLPIGNLKDRSIAVVTLGTAKDHTFTDMCRRYADITDFGSVVTPDVISKLKKFDDVIVLVANDKSETKLAAEQLAKLDNVISVFLVNPYKMARMSALVKASKGVILGYDDTPTLREYAAQAVFGGIKVDGRLPVTLKGLFARGAGMNLPKTRLAYGTPTMGGMNESLTDSIDAIVNEAIAGKAMPGAQVLIARHGVVVLDKAYGNLTEGGEPVEPFSVYDLASVSKTIGTLPGIMLAVDKGLIDIEKPLSTYVKGLRGTDKEDILVKEFLFHETGMPASVNMFNIMMDTTTFTGPLIKNKPDADHSILIQKGAYGHNTAKLRNDIVKFEKSDKFPIEMAEGMYVGEATIDTIWHRMYTLPLRPNKSYNYSCVNFSLLMDGEQQTTGIPHQIWCDSLIWKPLGATTMGYRPLERIPKSRIAPTEKDTYLRKQLVHGYVHDETAAFFGGVSGNAGLFSNADDIAKICQMWLNGGEYGGVRVLSPETVELFTTTVSPTCRRGLGFDKPDTKNPRNSPTTSLANGSTYGHTGFTGTIFWVDPENDMIMIFLTNRVNPTRDNAEFASRSVRSDIMKQALLAIPDRK